MMDNVDSVLWRLGWNLKTGGKGVVGDEGNISTSTTMTMLWETVMAWAMA